jgi:hypothetical protein
MLSLFADVAFDNTCCLTLLLILKYQADGVAARPGQLL